jgi:hypothetical protein
VTEKVLANTTAFILPSIPNIADTLAQFQQDAAKVDVELLIAIDQHGQDHEVQQGRHA